jgi:hypothetical protein
MPPVHRELGKKHDGPKPMLRPIFIAVCLLASSGCTARFIGRATLPEIVVAPGMSAQMHATGHVPFPGANIFAFDSDLPGPELELPARLQSKGSAGSWKWEEYLEYETGPSQAGRCPVGDQIPAQAAPSTECMVVRLQAYVERLLPGMPPLDLQISFIRPDLGARRTYVRLSGNAIPMHLVFKGPESPELWPQAWADAAETIAHEFLHAVIAATHVGEFPDQLAEEVAAHAFGRCARVAIGGLQYVDELDKGNLTLHGDSLLKSTLNASWQASKDMDEKTKQAIADTKSAIQEDRAQALFAICRSQLAQLSPPTR